MRTFTRPIVRTFLVLLGLLAEVLVVGSGAGPAYAGESPTAITLDAESVPAGSQTDLTGRLTDTTGVPIADAAVTLRRRIDGEWRLLGTVTTALDGSYTLATTLSKDAARNVYHARYAGDETYAAASAGPVRVELVRRDSVLTIAGPDRIVDESSVELTFRHLTRSGEPVPGWIRVETYVGGRWRLHRSVQLGSTGRGRLTVAPRVDTRWRAVAPDRDWVWGDVSGTHYLDNVPRMAPVRLPSDAPKPRIQLPPQTRAVGSGANPVVTRIPNEVWRQMVGRSWHSGCPVGRSGLRLLRVNYWAFDGYRRRGELVVAAGVVRKFVRAFSGLHARRLPLRAMYRVDRFGWSPRLRGANDYASMAADNTSAFNCRDVVNNPGVGAPPAWGRAVGKHPGAPPNPRRPSVRPPFLRSYV